MELVKGGMIMGAKARSFKNVDFVRFVLAIAIVLYHSFHGGKSVLGSLFPDVSFFSDITVGTSFGYLAVDMFFVMAGFFLFFATDFSISIVDFVKKKLMRLYPLVVLFVILDIVSQYWIFNNSGYVPYNQVFRLLMMDNLGLSLSHSSITWYVSTLFWSMLFFFYVCKTFDKKYVNCLFAILLFFSYAFLIQANGGNIAGSNKSVAYVFNLGVLRAFGGMSVGYFLCEFWRRVKPRVAGVWSKMFYTLAECGLLYFVINSLIFHKIQFETNFVIILGFVGLFWLLLLKRGWVSQLFDNHVSTILGRYSYSIFIMHIFVIRILRKYVWMANADFVYAHPCFNVLAIIILSIFTGLLVYHLVEVPGAKLLKKSFF